MKLPQYLQIHTQDSADVTEMKEAINALIQLHYEVHDVGENQEFDPKKTFDYSGGPGC